MNFKSASSNAKATHIFFFSKNISVYVIFNDQNFNDTLTNDIISFEQLGPVNYYINIETPIPLFSLYILGTWDFINFLTCCNNAL